MSEVDIIHAVQKDLPEERIRQLQLAITALNTRLDNLVIGSSFTALWAGSWTSGSIALSDNLNNYKTIVVGSPVGMMMLYITNATSAHGSVRNLWGHQGQWHIVENLYYMSFSGTTMTMAYSQKLLNGTLIGEADAIRVVYGVK